MLKSVYELPNEVQIKMLLFFLKDKTKDADLSFAIKNGLTKKTMVIDGQPDVNFIFTLTEKGKEYLTEQTQSSTYESICCAFMSEDKCKFSAMTRLILANNNADVKLMEEKGYLKTVNKCRSYITEKGYNCIFQTEVESVKKRLKFNKEVSM